MEQEMAQQLQAEPVGSPPAYSEIDKYTASEPCDQQAGDDAGMNPKLSQHTWADFGSNSVFAQSGSSQYPSNCRHSLCCGYVAAGGLADDSQA